MDAFSTYLPKSQVKIEDEVKARKDIQVDLRERINSYIYKIDHEFALDNYDYVLQTVNDKTIKDIYRLLGPFDHYEYNELDDDLEALRSMNMEFVPRKSGAIYRGQVNIENNKPDGIGFKVFPNNAIFEGLFEEGQINGYGRAITSRGELYQGPFIYDKMEGMGLFQWPDGRVYYGNFKDAKKSGHGTYLWPSGQCYVGEFKADECHGEGIMYYPDGKEFKGAWKEGKKHGAATYKWPNGAEYFVNYVDGKLQGEGRLQNTTASLDYYK